MAKRKTVKRSWTKTIYIKPYKLKFGYLQNKNRYFIKIYKLKNNKYQIYKKLIYYRTEFMMFMNLPYYNKRKRRK